MAALSRRLAGRMEQLLRLTDWAWIVGAGVLAPFIFVMAIHRLTPLGGRDFGIQGTALLMPAAHFVGLWILWLIVPVQLIRWRMARRAGDFGFAGISWVGWLATGCALAFIPVVGWAAISHSDSGFWLEWVGSFDTTTGEASPTLFWIALALGGVPLLWLLVQVSLALLGRADRQLYRAASDSALVKVFASVLLPLALAIPAFKASERHQFRQSKVAVQMSKELRGILGY